MGVAVIFGLTVATVLTLVVVPVTYDSLDGFSDAIARYRERRRGEARQPRTARPPPRGRLTRQSLPPGSPRRGDGPLWKTVTRAPNGTVCCLVRSGTPEFQSTGLPRETFCSSGGRPSRQRRGCSPPIRWAPDASSSTHEVLPAHVSGERGGGEGADGSSWREAGGRWRSCLRSSSRASKRFGNRVAQGRPGGRPGGWVGRGGSAGNSGKRKREIRRPREVRKLPTALRGRLKFTPREFAKSV